MPAQTKYRGPAPDWTKLGAPILAVVIAFALTAPLVLASGANPLKAFYYLVVAPFTNRLDLLEIGIEAAPLILTGLAVTVAFTAKYWNIGAEGQLYAGAVAAAWAGVAFGKLPGAVLIPLTLVLGFGAGALWSLVCRLLRAKVDEVISTLLFNWVIIYLVGALLSGPWLDPVTRWPKSPEIAAAARLPILIPRSRLHLGILIALALVVAIHWLLKKTTLGFEIRTFGANPRAAKVSGMDEGKIMTIVALLSGGLAGLAGVMVVCGTHFHLIEGLAHGRGYTGIVVATLGGLNPWGTLLAALFIGALTIGGQTMHRMTQTPAPLAEVAQATILLTTIVVWFFSQHQKVGKGEKV